MTAPNPEGDRLTDRQRQLQNRETVTDLRIAEHPRPDHFLLHLSDTHLLVTDGRLYGSSVDSVATCGGSPTSSRRPARAPRRSSSPATSPTRRRRGVRHAPLHRRAGRRAPRRPGHLVHGQPRRPRHVPPELLGEQGSYRAGRPRLRRQRPPHHHAGHVRARPPPRRASPARSWTGSPRCSPRPRPHGTILALHHPPRALRPGPRGRWWSCATSSASPQVVEGSDVRSIIAGHVHYLDDRARSRASPSPSPRPPATRRT